MAVANSGGRELTNVVRVYLSDGRPNHTTENRAAYVASVLETRLGVKGSAIYPQVGRWGGRGEPGHVVEVAVPAASRSNIGKAVHEELQGLVEAFELTFYVTITRDVIAMEVW